LRLLAHSLALAPLGGVEICTLQDGVALAQRGHSLSVMYGADGPLRSAYASAGIGMAGPFSFDFDPRRAPRDLRSFAPAARTARRLAPDVLWLNRIEHLVWGQAVSRAAGCALVCHLHGPPVFGRMALAGRGVAHFVAVSDFIRDAYVERGIAPERITRIHNALPPGRYPRGGVEERAAARAGLGLPPDAPIVLCYGQMSAPKGLLTLLEAWPRVGGDAMLVLLDSAATPDPAVDAALSGVPRVRRFAMASDVVPFLHAADVVVFPTQLPEAFGRVVLEGMATGRPVVASRVGAVPELLSDRFLVEPRSSSQLAARIGELLDWRTSDPGLGEQCAASVERRFPFGAHVDRLEDVLRASA
jgi:glycosyltransferase involved in cell wall biosynthesis